MKEYTYYIKHTPDVSITFKAKDAHEAAQKVMLYEKEHDLKLIPPTVKVYDYGE